LIEDLFKILKAVKSSDKRIERMLDLGCGFGGLSILIASYLGASDVYGIDIEQRRIEVSKLRGVKAFKCDLETDKFPFPDEYFQLVTTFSVLDHITYWDNVMMETHRCLERGGYFIVSTTNLASVFDRIALLFDFQPRHVEFSRRKVFGVPRMYYAHPAGHIHTATYRALKEMLEYYGFKVLMVKGSTRIIGPWQGFSSRLLKWIYKMTVAAFPTMATRLFIVTRKD
jgi:ubiquinone/menaquinone biosynthesis C-methylase UbiE